MVDAPKAEDLPLQTRIALLEAKVRMISIILKGAVIAIASSLIAFFFGYH
jgi:hypothetical protein